MLLIILLSLLGKENRDNYNKNVEKKKQCKKRLMRKQKKRKWQNKLI